MSSYKIIISNSPISLAKNTIADLLSRRKDFEGGVKSYERVTLLPDHLFAQRSTRFYLDDDPDKRRQILHQIHDTLLEVTPESLTHGVC